MPALALTDLAQRFGLVKFYRAARARGVKPIVGCDVWLTHEAERDQPYPRAAARAVARRLPAARRLAFARLSHQPASRPRRAEARMAATRAQTG